MDGLDVAVATPDRQLVGQITDLVDRVSLRRQHAALSEHKRMEVDQLTRGTDPASVRSGPEAMIVVHQAGRLIGYGHLSGGPGSDRYVLELVVDDQFETPSPVKVGPAADALLSAAVDHIGALGGGTVRLWAAQATEVDDTLATDHDFHRERELIQMRCPLPFPGTNDPARRGPPIHTRPFRPGADEAAWLATNNRSFANHPEQGHWDLATLLEREREPWFDPDGLLLLDVDGRLAGSCWTKIHADTTPPLGEIYVIGVDPDFHGHGWGRALTAAGLDWLAGRGLQFGMLYVDADNRAAVTMYRSMGFEPDHVDRAYSRVIGG
jgi:mycothiol synthase